LVLAVVAVMRGRSEVVAFGYRLPASTVSKATAIATLGLGSVMLFTLTLLLTQPMDFDVLLFEVVSALGTVGLSVGATARLDDVGKVVIMACMFAGRVGPLTLLLLLSRGESKHVYHLPQQDLQVG
jgi:trk system potassium uptake protein TrkH